MQFLGYLVDSWNRLIIDSTVPWQWDVYVFNNSPIWPILNAERSCRASSMIPSELLNCGERVKTIEEPLVEYVKTWGSCCLYHSGICMYKYFLHSFWPGTNIIPDLYSSYIYPVIVGEEMDTVFQMPPTKRRLLAWYRSVEHVLPHLNLLYIIISLLNT